jgi:hypothetical protein
MTFVRGLLAGRSHLAVLLGLAVALATIGAVRRIAVDAPSNVRASLDRVAPSAEAFPLRPKGPLDDRERNLAAAAWSYFERNTDPGTGLTSSVRGHPVTTAWELGSQLLATVSAEDLGLVRRPEASARLARTLRSIAALPPCEGGLPNKAYDVRTLEMVGYDGAPAPAGTGWSALDVARLLLSLSLVSWRHPEHAPLVAASVSRWRLERLSDGRALRGAVRDGEGALAIRDEGRLGYEQYAAKALLRWGLPVSPALDYGAHLGFAQVQGQAIPRDTRQPRDHGGAPAPVVPEPWLLDALEHGFDAVTLPAARMLLYAQQRRYEAVGRITSVSEDALDRPPWFAYSALLAGDAAWTALGPDGARAESALTFSTKAAVAWGVLFSGSYPDRLLAAAVELIAPGEGLYAGRYDATWEVNRALSLNTNAVVLEALAYRVRGPASRPLASVTERRAPAARSQAAAASRHQGAGP